MLSHLFTPYRVIPAIPGADFGGRIDVPSYTSNSTVDRDILAEVIAQGASRRLATVLALAAVTSTINAGAKP